MPIISRDSRRDNGDQILTSWIGWMEALQGPDRPLQLFCVSFFVFLLVFVNNSQS